MHINVNTEMMMCKETLQNSYNGVIAEYNFLVPATAVCKLYQQCYESTNKYDSFDEFIETYDPDSEGIVIYQYCKNHDLILYEDWNPVDWDMSDLQDQMAGQAVSNDIIK